MKSWRLAEGYPAIGQDRPGPAWHSCCGWKASPAQDPAASTRAKNAYGSGNNNPGGSLARCTTCVRLMILRSPTADRRSKPEQTERDQRTNRRRPPTTDRQRNPEQTEGNQQAPTRIRPIRKAASLGLWDGDNVPLIAQDKSPIAHTSQGPLWGAASGQF